MRITLSTAALLAAASTVSAQTEVRTYTGDQDAHFLGLSVGAAGDVNGDGFDDVVVGVRGDSTNGPNAGAARVYSGADGSLLWQVFGNSSYDYFGLTVAGVGDVDGDGTPDVAVGAPRDDSHIAGGDAGTVFVYSGATGLEIQLFRGDSAGEQLGRFVDAAGDVNGDGFDDYVVGAPFSDENGTSSGSAHVISGRDASVLHSFFGVAAGDEFGRNLGGAGDVDGDGTPDIAVGARLHDHGGNADAGAVYVFSGADGSSLQSHFGTTANEQLGQWVQGAGDVNRDGFADVIAGAHLADFGGADSGRATVFSGVDGTTIWTFDGANAGDNLGRSVDTAGDVDGDGHADLLVGADLANGKGAAIVFSGQTGTQLFPLTGVGNGDLFGHAVSSAGDVDDDGFGDVIVGAFRENGGYSDAGGAHVYASDSIGTPPRARVFGRPCTSSNGHLPRIDVVDLPAIGETARFDLRGAKALRPTALLLGTLATIDLTFLGAFDCVLEVMPVTQLVTITTGPGKATETLDIPNAIALIGVEFGAQWVVLDPAANSLGAVTGNAALLTVGSR